VDAEDLVDLVDLILIIVDAHLVVVVMKKVDSIVIIVGLEDIMMSTEEFILPFVMHAITGLLE